MFNLEENFIKENMMGPNSITILDELCQKADLKKGMKILDLGCGMGLSSIYLAKKFEVEVFAVDLWITATDNYNRFKAQGVDNSVVPIHANAYELPFADNYFDAIISVDSYHYFGNNSTYFEEKLKPLVKDDGQVLLAFPSMEYEIKEIPEEMKPYWEDEALQMWQHIAWWEDNFKGKLNNLSITQLECYDKAWQEWLQTDNSYAIEDRKMFSADNGRYMKLISIIGNK